MTPEQIHQLGLSEVARITKEFEKVRRRSASRATSTHFFDYMRTEPEVPAEEPRAAAAATIYAHPDRRSTPRCPHYFSTGAQDAAGDPALPAVPREVRGRRLLRAAARPTASRPGTFYFNAYDLPSRSTWEETTLFLHEGEPGHHFQISLAQENKALPAFMRFGGNTAYVEGWALYAETLGYDMGFYKDPYQRFGTLNDEMLRAMRLVVDTGIHAKGWTRDQAIDYMLDHSGMAQTDATAEVERYIAIPSQATAYKIGALTIQRLRDKAKAALGAEVRHPRIPRPGARHRRAAAVDPRSEDRPLDRGEEGQLACPKLDERRELHLALDEVGLVAAHGRVGDEHVVGAAR